MNILLAPPIESHRLLIWGNPLFIWRVLKQRIVLKPVVSVSNHVSLVVSLSN